MIDYFEMVKEDIRQTLGRAFESADVNLWSEVHQFGTDSPIREAEDRGVVAVVSWRFDGNTHVRPLAGIQPDGRSVTDVRGVTIVRIFPGDEEPKFIRFFNELDLFFKLGHRLSTRPLTEEFIANLVEAERVWDEDGNPRQSPPS